MKFLMFRIGAIIFAAITLLAGCGASGGSHLKELEAAQVREYQGEKLSSIASFRENSIHGPQDVDISKYRLRITGLVDFPLVYTYDDAVAKYQPYKKLITLYCVEGWSVTLVWEGILMKDLIRKAGVKPAADTIIFHAWDGYTTSLPLRYVLDNNLLLAYKINGVVLPAERGYPFQLAAEDKWGYKWIKWVTDIELSDNTNYHGYWESEGYSNDGSLDRPFIDR